VNRQVDASQSTALPEWATWVRLLFGGIMAWGGVMHFTADPKVWKSALLNAMADSGFLWREIGIVNVVAGVALLLNRATPVAALVLLPITFNIFLFHLWRLDAFGLTIGVPVIALNSMLIYAMRAYYRPLFA
jgi:putative oxidoreductase